MACANKPESAANRPVTRTPDGRKVDARLVVELLPELRANPPKPCRAATITSGVYDKVAYRQAIPYGTQEWRVTYSALRNSHEGLHGTAKSAAANAIEDAGRRRVRGIASASVCLAFQLAADGIQKVADFLDASKDHVDADGRRWVARAPRKVRPYPFADDPDGADLDRDPDPPTDDRPTAPITD